MIVREAAPAAIPLDLAQRAARIRSIGRQAIVEIGRELLAVKDALPHGDFAAWLQRELSWSDRTARNYMDAARLADRSPETVAALPPKAVYLLASPSTPPAIREWAEASVKGGMVPTIQDVQERVGAARAQERQAREDAKRSPKEVARRRAANAREARETERRRAQFAAEVAALEAGKATLARMIAAAIPPDDLPAAIEAATAGGLRDLGEMIAKAAQRGAA